MVYYGGSDIAMEVASRFRLALLEPPLDLLARLPMAFLSRAVDFCKFSDLGRLQSRTFVKPADALNKAFDAGIYADVTAIRVPRGIDAHTPVLVAEPVEWLAEYRCFVCEGQLLATSPYLSFGRPSWRPYEQRGVASKESASVLAFCARLLSQPKLQLPPAFVMDVGLIEERGWAVVEFNPVWCSGLLGADPKRILRALQRASRDTDKVELKDRRWLVRRN
jgi:hypothetical protein